MSNFIFMKKQSKDGAWFEDQFLERLKQKWRSLYTYMRDVLKAKTRTICTSSSKLWYSLEQNRGELFSRKSLDWFVQFSHSNTDWTFRSSIGREDKKSLEEIPLMFSWVLLKRELSWCLYSHNSGAEPQIHRSLTDSM
jgi:hypothetical protein